MCLHPDVMAALLKTESPDIIEVVYRSAYAAKHGEAQGSAAVTAPAVEPTKIEAKRIADRERVRRKRADERASKAQLDMFPISLATSRDTIGDIGTISNATSATPATAPPPQVFPLREISNPLSSPTEVGGGGSRASPSCSISPEAFQVADEIAAIAKVDPDKRATPPGWCGAPMWAQARLNAGWTRETMLAGTRAGMYGRDGPPETPQFFDKPIARIHLKLSAPLPKIVDLESTYVRAATPPRRKTMLDVADDLAAEFAAKRHA